VLYHWSWLQLQVCTTSDVGGNQNQDGWGWRRECRKAYINTFGRLLNLKGKWEEVINFDMTWGWILSYCWSRLWFQICTPTDCVDTLWHQRAEWAFAAMARLSEGCHCCSFSWPLNRRVPWRCSPICNNFLTGWFDHGGLHQGGSMIILYVDTLTSHASLCLTMNWWGGWMSTVETYSNLWNDVSCGYPPFMKLMTNIPPDFDELTLS